MVEHEEEGRCSGGGGDAGDGAASFGNCVVLPLLDTYTQITIER